MIHRRQVNVTLLASTAALISVLAVQLNAQPSYAAPNEGLRNGYRAIPNWAKLPDGRSWGATAGVAVAPNGNIWAIDRCGMQHGCGDSKLDPIIEFDPSGKPLRKFGAGLIVGPHGLFVDRDSNVWVTDESVSEDQKRGVQVTKFSPEGKVLLRLGKAGVAGEGPDVFGSPTDVAVAANGDIFVTDGHDQCKCPNRRVMKFSKDGKFIKAWGKHGSGPGEFGGLHGLALDSQGRLFIADRANSRVHVFTPDGKFIASWEQFGRPSALVIDKDDNLYVSESQGALVPNPKIKRGIRIGSVKDGKVRAFIADPRSTVQGLAVDRQGNLYGAENGNFQSEVEHGTRDVKKYVKE
jgi:sugar lactone lactonase YvrE